MKMKISIFWDIAPRSPYINRPFGGMFDLHLQGRKSAKQETSESRWLGRMTDSSLCLATCSRWFLARLIFDPENGGETILRSVGSHTDYTALYPRRWQFSDSFSVYRTFVINK
jgi:hypothetical protein